MKAIKLIIIIAAGILLVSSIGLFFISADRDNNLNVDSKPINNDSLTASIVDNNQNNESQKTMEIKLDNKVTEEITANQGPVMQIDKEADYVAVLKTSEGDIKIQLNASATPITVNNFIYLVRKGFYDNTIFHRVISGFMIQGGDPLGTGFGGPGYKFNHEPFTGEYKRGIIAMANSGLNTNGSQFFIMHKDFALSPDYVIFGQVIEGLDVVDKIAGAEVKLGGDGAMSSPVNPIKILSAEIFQVQPIK